jgi:hypothetical protein
MLTNESELSRDVVVDADEAFSLRTRRLLPVIKYQRGSQYISAEGADLAIFQGIWKHSSRRLPWTG